MMPRILVHPAGRKLLVVNVNAQLLDRVGFQRDGGQAPWLRKKSSLPRLWKKRPAVRRPRWLGVQAWIAAAAAAVVLAATAGIFGKETSWIARAFLCAALAAVAVWGLILALWRGKTWTAMAARGGLPGVVRAAVGLVVASRPPASGPTAKRHDALPDFHPQPLPDLHPQPLPSEPLAIAPQNIHTSLVERIARCDGVR